MARSFNGSAESTTPVGEILMAFCREDYWLDRLASGDAVTTLDSLVSQPDGTVVVEFTQHLGRQLLPGFVAKVVPGDLKLQYVETWTPDDDDRVRGQIDAVVTGGLGSCTAVAWLEPTAVGAQLRFDGSVEVKIPLVGSNLEKMIGADLAANIPSVMLFTETWIADRT